MMNYSWLVEPAEQGERVDQWLTRRCESLTRSGIQKLCEQEHVTCNGRVLRKQDRLGAGMLIEIAIPDPVTAQAVPQPIPLDIIYEDADLLVVNKPKGMVVHPAAGNPDGTLVNALLYHCGGQLSGINGVIRPGIVHRIDKNTSGLLVVAKNDRTHQGLAEQIGAHTMTRMYETVVYGSLKLEQGTIDAPIGRHPADRKKMSVTTNHARNAVTHYSVIARYSGFTLLQCRLETGRTHQIRVHLAHIGHPVAGDDVYGPKKVIQSLGGQCLHAKVIGFHHPTSGEYLEFESPLPAYFTHFLQTLQ